MPLRPPSFPALLAPTLTMLELVTNETGLLKSSAGGGNVDRGGGLGPRLRSGGQESSSGRQTQEGKTSDSMPNRNQARLIDIRRGGESRSAPPLPAAPSASFPLLVLGNPAGVVSRQHCPSPQHLLWPL